MRPVYIYFRHLSYFTSGENAARRVAFSSANVAEKIQTEIFLIQIETFGAHAHNPMEITHIKSVPPGFVESFWKEASPGQLTYKFCFKLVPMFDPGGQRTL